MTETERDRAERDALDEVPRGVSGRCICDDCIREYWRQRWAHAEALAEGCAGRCKDARCPRCFPARERLDATVRRAAHQVDMETYAALDVARMAFGPRRRRRRRLRRLVAAMVYAAPAHYVPGEAGWYLWALFRVALIAGSALGAYYLVGGCDA